jgi:hypothetical protein
MGSSRRTISFCGALTVAFVRSAAADPTPAEKALAEALFRQGRDLMNAANFKDACPKLAESQRLDAGLGTLLYLADCHEREGKTASAWGEFSEAASEASRAGQRDREEAARKRMTALEPRLSQLKLAMAAVPDGAVLKLDGKTLSMAVLGAAMPVDPGPHRIEVAAPGKRAYSDTIIVPSSPGVKSVEIPALPDDAPPVFGAPPPAAPALSQTPPGASANEAPAPGHTLGYVVGGVGVGALLAGGYFGLRVFSLKQDQDAHCPNKQCDREGLDIQDEAKTAGTLSTVLVGAGLVGVGVGAYLILSNRGSDTPPAASVRFLPAVGTSFGGVLARGAFLLAAPSPPGSGSRDGAQDGADGVSPARVRLEATLRATLGRSPARRGATGRPGKDRGSRP